MQQIDALLARRAVSAHLQCAVHEKLPVVDGVSLLLCTRLFCARNDEKTSLYAFVAVDAVALHII